MRSSLLIPTINNKNNSDTNEIISRTNILTSNLLFIIIMIGMHNAI